MSFMVIALGSVCLAAAWIMTASDPYSDLANRVTEVQEPPVAEAEPVPLFEVATTTNDAIPPSPDAEEPVLEVPPIGVEAPEPEPLNPVEASQIPTRHPTDLPETASAGAAAELIGPVPPAGMVAEWHMRLSGVQRRAIQRRLAMTGSELGEPDGIFGPQTRDAIDAFQMREGLRGTGYLDETTLALLIERTEADYAAWAESQQQKPKATQRTRIRRSDTRLAEAPLPARRGAGDAGECRRNADGSVLGHQSLGCDLRGFGEGLRGVLTGNLPARGPAQLEGLADPDR